MSQSSCLVVNSPALPHQLGKAFLQTAIAAHLRAPFVLLGIIRAAPVDIDLHRDAILLGRDVLVELGHEKMPIVQGPGQEVEAQEDDLEAGILEADRELHLEDTGGGVA